MGRAFLIKQQGSHHGKTFGTAQKKEKSNGFSFGSAVVLVLCFIGVSFGLYLWQAAFSIGQPTPTVDDDDFRPTIGEPPYRIVIDAGHGGSDPGAREWCRKAR